MGLGYDIMYGAGAVLSGPWWGYHLLRTGKWRTDWPGRFGVGQTAAAPGRRTLLIHAVSVGEVNAVQELVARLAAHGSAGSSGPTACGKGVGGACEAHAAAESGGPDLKVVIATTTNTGYCRAQSLFGPQHTVVRYPLDFSGAVRRMLDRVRPDAVALVELEVWPNFIGQCTKRAIPVCVINGRLSARSFRRYRLFKPLVRPTFARLAAAAVQTPQYAERFRALGVPPHRIQVLDTMKWDTARIADEVDGADELAHEMGIDRDRPLIVAGSTGPGEERMLIDACPPDAQLLLAPRKPQRFDEVAALAPGMVRREAATGRNFGEASTPPGSTRLFLLNTLGELRKAYALADLVIVGRSFLGLYGSDVIEPIALGKPTIVGPHHSDFEDVVSALRAGGGLQVTTRPGELAAQLLADRDRAAELARAGRAVIRARQGATARHMDLLLDLMPNRPEPANAGPAQRRKIA